MLLSSKKKFMIFKQNQIRTISIVSFFLFVLSFLLFSEILFASDVLSPEDVLKLKSCNATQISPDGKWILYTVSVPREADEKPGGAYSELYLISVESRKVQPFITGKLNVSSPRWSPEGTKISFLSRRGGSAVNQVWMIAKDGGESVQITDSKTSVIDYRWHPSGKRISYIATTPKSKREKQLAEDGYGFVFYEENLKHRNLYQIDLENKTKIDQLTEGVTVWDFEFSPNGKTIAAAISDKNLIDFRYMFRRIFLLDLTSKKLKQLSFNTGKLGNYAFSPDGSKLAYSAALERKDHAVSQAFVIDIKGGIEKNLTIPDFSGHVNWVGWKDKNTVLYRAGEGVWPTLSIVKATGGERKVILNAQNNGVIFGNPNYTKNFKHFVMIGNTPGAPGNVYYWKQGKKPIRLTTLNPWIENKKLGKQEVIRFKARDGLEIEGLLIYPVGYKQGNQYPLIVIVHGGPESHYSNGWMTSYSRPGQVLAGKGYVVFYPNYRASTGYGVDFGLEGYEDPAGKEFDDIADGIEYLIDQGIADPDRVGLGGGSYGGYAAGWFSSYYTRYVKAVCMFVGISNVISKRGTTDIPYEELYVHSGQKLEKMWEENLKRSPVYWAHQSKTAVLILGGTADTRVHPSQSLEYYRRLKMNEHTAVRLIQYPGEGHGNRRQPGRIDFLHRTLLWYDWYVKDKKPLDGALPPLDISDKYGLKLEE